MSDAVRPRRFAEQRREAAGSPPGWWPRSARSAPGARTSPDGGLAKVAACLLARGDSGAGRPARSVALALGGLAGGTSAPRRRGQNRANFRASEAQPRRPTCSVRPRSGQFQTSQFSSVQLISAGARSVEDAAGPGVGGWRGRGGAALSAGFVLVLRTGPLAEGRMPRAHLPTAGARRESSCAGGAQRGRWERLGVAAPQETLRRLPVVPGPLPRRGPPSVTSYGGVSGYAVVYKCFS